MKKGKIKSIILLSIITVLVALLAFITFANFPVAGYKNGVYDFNSIIKIIGSDDGLSAEFNKGAYYKLTPVSETAYEEEDGKEIAINSVVDTLRARLNYLGYENAAVVAFDDGSIGIGVEYSENIATDIEAVVRYGAVEFRDSDGNVILNESHIKKASAKQQDTSYLVVVELTGAGKKVLAENVDGSKQIGIYLGEKVLLSPSAEIPTDGTIYISGNATMEAAKRQALQLRGGMEVEFLVNGEEVTDETTAINPYIQTPTYGKINATVIALIVALALILVLVAVVYRGFSIAANLAILAQVLLTLFFIAIIPGITISTGGIVGILASVFVTVAGAFVVLSGVKKEYAIGKTLRAAAKQSYKKATFLMLDITVVCGVAALLMFFICTGMLNSFATTFGIGLIVSALVNQLLLRLLVKLVLPLPNNEEVFFNLKKEEAEVNA